jgi:fluoride exporter
MPDPGSDAASVSAAACRDAADHGPPGPRPRSQHPHPPALPPWRQVAAVAAGGAIGGSLRHGLGLAYPVLPGAFPWVTLSENLLGAFGLGLLLTLLLTRWQGAGTLRPFLATGVLGSFTTFSTLSLEVVQLAAGGQPGLALVYSAASLVLGLAAALAGVKLGHRLARRSRTGSGPAQ